MCCKGNGALVDPLHIDWSGYLTRLEAAQLLGRSTERIDQLMQRGDLVTLTTPLGRLISRTSIEQRRVVQDQGVSRKDYRPRAARMREGM